MLKQRASDEPEEELFYLLDDYGPFPSNILHACACGRRAWSRVRSCCGDEIVNAGKVDTREGVRPSARVDGRRFGVDQWIVDLRIAVRGHRQCWIVLAVGGSM